ncbi:hypothetical protein BDY21DRAFT_13916 [Lineolata rhizophorae]|uniref:Uncharacterized protein n=1 Tax=Lineolata rhizophorae TaxID=578093 RepID=A0A6A6PFD0_9PEZI|nr:hypothetical protein BDY21DRAFT_13916 [Lineolata rhizophorae]
MGGVQAPKLIVTQLDFLPTISGRELNLYTERLPDRLMLAANLSAIVHIKQNFNHTPKKAKQAGSKKDTSPTSAKAKSRMSTAAVKGASESEGRTPSPGPRGHLDVAVMLLPFTDRHGSSNFPEDVPVESHGTEIKGELTLQVEHIFNVCNEERLRGYFIDVEGRPIKEEDYCLLKISPRVAKR